MMFPLTCSPCCRALPLSKLVFWAGGIGAHVSFHEGGIPLLQIQCQVSVAPIQCMSHLLAVRAVLFTVVLLCLLITIIILLGC